MSLAPIDRLQTVAKILIDARMQELIEENRKLKLVVFWQNHTPHHLSNAIEEGNYKSEVCECGTCFPEFRRGPACTILSFMQNAVTKHGMSYAVAGEEGCPFEPIKNPSIGGLKCKDYFPEHAFLQECYDFDVHIIFRRGMHFPHEFAYGAKLWKPTHANDPELAKLHLLIQNNVSVALDLE